MDHSIKQALKLLTITLFSGFIFYESHSQNVGIGTTIPQSRLHIVDGVSGYAGGYFQGITLEGNGNRYISLIPPNGGESGVLFGNNFNAAAGGIVYNNGGLNSLQLRTNGNTTRMTIDANGNVGIGINPILRLDVNGRIQIRGTSPNDAGIWLSNAGGVGLGFLGLENDNYIGFYGANGAGWKFTMNTASGALKINGAEGNAGQIIKSNGPGQPVGWSSSLNMLYNNMVQYDEAGTHTVIAFSTTKIPGLNTLPLVISSRSKVIFSGSMNVTSNTCFGCGGSYAEFFIVLNGPGIGFPSAGSNASNIASGETKTFAIANQMFTLNPGTYNIDGFLRNSNLSGPSVTGQFGRINVIVVQE